MALRAVLAAVQQQELAIQAMVPTVAVVRVALGYQQPVVAVLCHMARVADWESV